MFESKRSQDHANDANRAHDPEPAAEPTQGRIVGIGASAGGLESLEQLFGSIPPDTGMAFVVVQHLSPDFRSLMDELIARHSEMPVVLAENHMPVQANRIYLMPPRKEMIIRDRHLVLTDKEPQAFTLPIDTFFRSLAQDVGNQAVAVVLSGSGSDGSRGIVDVKRAGGLVLAETPASAKFDGMPLSAAETGVVDHSHAPRDLARVLCGQQPGEADDTALLSEDPAMDVVLKLLRNHFGIDFSLYKMSTVGRRIQRRVDLLHIPSLGDYADTVARDGEELNALYQDLLIGVTQFFRDPQAFDRLETEVIPDLLDKVPVDEELRVWIAGCATGEEAYSLAMLFWEAFAERDRPLRLKILATDVHQVSLDHAGAGVYGDEQLQFVTPPRLQRFFTKRSSGYQVSQDLRQLIVFARHNVIKDAPFTKMHFISCRNLLIYFQPQVQRTVMSLFHFGLTTGGVLFLGASETPGGLTDEFIALDDHWKIYRKRRDVQLLSQIRLPLDRRPARRPTSYTSAELPRRRPPDPLILDTYDQLLDRHMPQGFLVDEELMLVDSFAGAERLLKVRRRRPSSSLPDLLDDELRGVVSGAIQRAVKERTAIAYSGVRIPAAQPGADDLRCTMTAEPLYHPRTGARHVLVTFKPEGSPGHAVADADAPQAMPIAQASHDRLDTLESELAYTRETLQATIEELETSNEEMQATNEELVASNEELQSTNEELHSVNEELYTVNAEYQQKILELKELNTDMAHLLEGTDVGTVFLDRELRIRRFTSRIAGVFRFQPFDIGRRISDFSHNIERPQLIEEIEQVRQTGQVIEDEVRDRGAVPYFLRILPYRLNRSADLDGEPAIDGVVLTLTDISALDRARSHVAELSAIVESSEDAIIGNALVGTITTWNRGAERLYGYTPAQTIGRDIRILVHDEHRDEIDRQLDRVRRGEIVEHVQSLSRHRDGTRVEVSTTLSPVHDRHGAITGASAIGRDISPLLAAQRELQERQRRITTLLEQAEEGARRREQFIAMLSHELRNPLSAVMNATTLIKKQPDIDSVARCQAVIERQTRHMKRLLDDLLDVSRITRGKFQLINDDIDLRGPIEAAIESTSPLFAERGVTLHHSLPHAPMPVRGDASRLVQVVVNLLSNAANYSPRASVVQLVVTIEDGRGVLRVIDHGVGIERDLQDRIFDLFVQSEQRLDRSRGGLGVGLSLAKNIIDLHGGMIVVHSDGPGRGSEFRVSLPLLERSALQWGPQHTPARGRRDRCRIVLVDDQADSREMLRMLLESRDHIVIDVEDGPTAIEVIVREKPDVAFIDIGLPVMNGYEIAQRIRDRPELEDVMLVALTGYGAASDVTAAHAAGFDEHVIKPAELTKLERILERRKPAVVD